MKTLYLIRHAKSSWDSFNVADFDRTLNERGLKDAPLMANRLKEKGIMPDLMVCSTAKRTRLTAGLFAKELGYAENDILYKDAIYEASENTLLKVLNEIPEQADSVFVFGHNPAITYLVNTLTGSRIDNVPTCGIACMRIEGSWAGLDEDGAELIWFDYPKNGK